MNNFKIKKSSIISASRRTDIPAFYGEWFIDKLNRGVAGYENPFNNNKYYVSLKPEDVNYFIFWSNNFIPFCGKLKIIEQRGYKFYFNYTINNYPSIFEPNLPETEALINNLKNLSDKYSPKSINWRYDPIIITNNTNFDYHLKNFNELLKKLSGYIERCYFSYVFLYDKVKKRFNELILKNNINLSEINNEQKINFANKLADMAESYNVKMYSCCGDYLAQNKIKKASCIDSNILSDLFNDKNVYKSKPTRKECGCSESIDIGRYDSCLHNCVYCYANSNLPLIKKNYKLHNPESLFLNNNINDLKIK